MISTIKNPLYSVIVLKYWLASIFIVSWLAIPNIDEKINSEHKRGWGLQLMKELMDTVEFESSEAGTTVTMTKNK